MASEWPQVPLGEVSETFDTLRVPVKQSERRPGNYPYYGASGIVDYVDSFIFDGDYLLVAEDGENLKSRKTPVAFMARGRFWVNNHAHILRGSTVSETEFLCYALQIADINSFLSGSTMPKLTQGNLAKVLVFFPPLTEQRRVVGLLGTIDRRIANLESTSRTLESLARATFKSWFVDFDPARAKAEGREPEGMDAATAALFPSEFQESTLGMIPAGWSVKKVEEVAERVAMGPFGSSIKVETFVPSGVPVISGNHLRTFILDDGTFNFISEEHALKLARAAVAPGDIIFTHAGNIGSVSIIPKHSRYSRYVVSQRQFFLRCDNSKVSANYVVLYFTSSEGKHKLLANSSSVGVPSIARPVTYLRSIEILVPERHILNAFDKIVCPMFESIQKNRQRIVTLAEIRDTLLPRLISGKLRVPEVEKLVEAVL